MKDASYERGVAAFLPHVDDFGSNPQRQQEILYHGREFLDSWWKRRYRWDLPDAVGGTDVCWPACAGSFRKGGPRSPTSPKRRAAKVNDGPDGTGSVEAWIVRKRRQERILSAHPPKHLTPQLLDAAIEHEVGQDG